MKAMVETYPGRPDDYLLKRIIIIAAHLLDMNERRAQIHMINFIQAK